MMATAISSAAEAGAHGGFLAPEVPVQMIALGLLIMAAHLGGKLFYRLRLSEVTGQLIGGALVGPYCLGLLGFLGEGPNSPYADAVHSFHFFVFVFLGIVAFGIGEELHLSRLRRVGRAAVTICLVQGAATWFAISTGFYFVGHRPLLESLLIGSIGIATAPAVTFVLMNQFRIEGRLRHVLGSLVVLDDMIEVILFSLLMQISLRQGQASFASAFGQVGKEVIFALLLGGLIYVVLVVFVRSRALSLEGDGHVETDIRPERAFLERIFSEHPSPSVEILLLVAAAVALGTGVAYYFHWPFLITAAFAGFLVANFHTQAIFDSLKIENLAAVLNLMFFALIGANIDLGGLTGETGWLALLYIVTRLTGKLVGTWVGCKIAGEDEMVTACLPTLMLPQAGVAAVEAVYASAVLGRPDLAAIILPAIVFFEVVGVFLVDRGLKKWQRLIERAEAAERRATQRDSGRAAAARGLMTGLSPERVCPTLKGATKKEVIQELVDLAITHSSQHIDRTQALQVIGERERLTPTGMGGGLALPHCKLMGLEKPVLALGIRGEGIEFGGIDDSPCDIFLLILSPSRDPGEHLKMLSAAAHTLGNEDVRERLRQAVTADEIWSIFTNLV